MALIKCIECGKEFSEYAQACPICGCPTSIILSNIKGTEQKRIAGSENVVAEYDILGEPFIVTEALDKSLRMKKMLFDFCQELSSKIESIYKGMGSIDKVLELIPGDLAETLDICAEGASQVLVANGVYEYDKESFYAKYEELFDTSDLLRPIVERYLKILDLESEISTYHDYIARERKNVWQGGGFGIGGAIKGHIKAQMLNYGNAFLHSIPDSRRRSQDQEKIRRMKAQLYNDPKSLAAVVDGYKLIVSNVMNAVFSELEQAGIIEETAHDSRKATSYLNNAIGAEMLSMEQRVVLCRKAFMADPLNAHVIETILFYLRDYDGISGLRAYANQYGF